MHSVITRFFVGGAFAEEATASQIAGKLYSLGLLKKQRYPKLQKNVVKANWQFPEVYYVGYDSQLDCDGGPAAPK